MRPPRSAPPASGHRRLRIRVAAWSGPAQAPPAGQLPAALYPPGRPASLSRAVAAGSGSGSWSLGASGTRGRERARAERCLHHASNAGLPRRLRPRPSGLPALPPLAVTAPSPGAESAEQRGTPTRPVLCRVSPWSRSATARLFGRRQRRCADCPQKCGDPPRSSRGTGACEWPGPALRAVSRSLPDQQVLGQSPVWGRMWGAPGRVRQAWGGTPVPSVL